MDTETTPWLARDGTELTPGRLRRAPTATLKRLMHEFGLNVRPDHKRKDLVDELLGRVFGLLPD